MTSSPTRAEVLLLVDQAINQGARIGQIAQAIELSERTLRRWRETAEKLKRGHSVYFYI
jgi:transposase-like protein